MCLCREAHGCARAALLANTEGSALIVREQGRSYNNARIRGLCFPSGPAEDSNREQLSSLCAAIKFAPAATISDLTIRFATGAYGWSRRRSVALTRFPLKNGGASMVTCVVPFAADRLSRVATRGDGASSGSPACRLASFSALFAASRASTDKLNERSTYQCHMLQ